MNLLLRLLVTAASAYVLQELLSGVHFSDFPTTLVFAVVLGLLNTFFTPVLKFLGFPISFLTLGFFSLVINALVMLVADKIVVGMQIDGFWWAFIFSILLSLLSSAIHSLLGTD